MIYPSKNVVVPDVKPVVFHRVGNCERVKCQFKYPPNCTKPTISQYKYDFSKKTRTKSRRPINYCNHKKAFHIYRYMKSANLEQMLSTGQIAFIRPSIWKDSFESLFYKPNITIKGKNYDVVCLCTKYDWIVGEEAAWSSYGGNEHPVRVEFNFSKFVSLLNDCTNREDVDFYITTVDYSLRRKEILQFHKDCKSFASLEEYLTYLSLKRIAFSHENELRIFAVKEGGSFKDAPNGIVKFSLWSPEQTQQILNYVQENNHCKDNGEFLITEITLPPYSDNINRLIKTAKLISPSFECRQSKLYEIGNSKECSSTRVNKQ